MIRALIYALLLFVMVPANATTETIAATPKPKLCPAQQSNKFLALGQEFCNTTEICATLGVVPWSGGANYVICNTTPTRTTVEYTFVPDVGGYTCPDSSWTLSGSTCTRNTSCEPGFEWDASKGQCRKTCNYPAGNQTTSEDGQSCRCNLDLLNFNGGDGKWLEGAGSIPSTVCDGGCVRSTGFGLGGGGKWYVQGTSFTGATCEGTTPNSSTPKPEKKPPCAASEGVMTSSSGRVSCVPEGTDSARKPTVKDSENKETKPDGEVVTKTKTTTCDPATGACYTNETTTSSNGSTSSSETNSGGNGQGDNSGDEPGDCAKEPDSPICREGTPKERGHFGNGQDAKLQEAKAAVTNKLAQIKGDLSAKFSATASGGSGSLPCPPPITILGKSISVCVADYDADLSVIGAIIVFAASIIAVLLVVTA